jgi:hypothetical protein
MINSSCRAFRRKDGEMIANFRVQADLKGMETTTDGRYCIEYSSNGTVVYHFWLPTLSVEIARQRNS